MDNKNFKVIVWNSIGCVWILTIGTAAASACLTAAYAERANDKEPENRKC